MHGDPELIFPSKTKFSDCLRNGMPSHLGGFIPLVTDPFAVFISLLLIHYHHLMALLLCMLKKKKSSLYPTSFPLSPHLCPLQEMQM